MYFHVIVSYYKDLANPSQTDPLPAVWQSFIFGQLVKTEHSPLFENIHPPRDTFIKNDLHINRAEAAYLSSLALKQVD